MAVRAAVGASRRRVFRQLVTESLVLSALGAGLGVALASVLLDGILALMPAGTLPLEADVRLNLPVLLVAVAAAVLTGVVSGCVPAWQAMRVDLDTVLREEGRGTIGGGRQRLRRSLVAGEFALALTLLSGAGIAAGSLMALARTDVGFRTDGVLTFSLALPQSGSPEEGTRRRASSGRRSSGSRRCPACAPRPFPPAPRAAPHGPAVHARRRGAARPREPARRRDRDRQPGLSPDPGDADPGGTRVRRSRRRRHGTGRARQ
jgi:hypothetical protein